MLKFGDVIIVETAIAVHLWDGHVECSNSRIQFSGFRIFWVV